MFVTHLVLALLGLVSFTFAADGPLVRASAPTSGPPIPYVLNHLTGEAIQFYNVVWRILVSNESSGGAMTYFSFNGGYASTALPVHYHPGVSETFYGKILLYIL